MIHVYTLALSAIRTASLAFSQTVECRPVASLDHFLPEHLGNAGLVEEVPMGTSKVVKVTGCVVCQVCVHVKCTSLMF